MSDNQIPELTLDPAAAAAAEIPSLTLDPAATPAAPEPAKPEVKPVELDDSMLSEAEKKAVEESPPPQRWRDPVTGIYGIS